MRLRDVALAAGCLVLLAPAVLLTVLRLTEPSGARAVQAVAFTPFALLLYAATLVLLVVVMLVRRTAALAYAATAAVATAGLLLHAWWFAPLVLGDEPEPAAGAEPVVVMTTNVLRGTADGAELMDQVRDHEVDLLVVNEITVSSLADMEDAGLAAVLPFREGTPGLDESVPGTMVFSSEPTELIDELDTTLGGLVVDIGDIRLFAVHPMSPVWPDDWRSDHAAVLAAVEEGNPDFVVGDFNATPDHAPMRALDEAGYRDSVELTNGGFQPTWPQNEMFGFVGFLGAVAPIDHVLVSDEWAVTESETTELAGTDHKPVVAVVARD